MLVYWRSDAGGTRITKDESSRSAADGSSAAEAIGICESAIDCAAVGITAVVANESDEGENNGLSVDDSGVGRMFSRLSISICWPGKMQQGDDGSRR